MAPRCTGRAAPRATTAVTAARRRANRCRSMTASRILRTLDFGAMMTIAYALHARRARGGSAVPRQARCRAASADRQRTAPDRALRRPRRVRTWNGWSPARTTRASRPRSVAELDRRAGARPEGEMGVRLRRRHLSVRASRRSSAIRCSSAAPAASCTRCAPTPDACSGPSRPPGRFVLPSSPRRSCGRARAAVRRPDRLVLRARRRDRDADGGKAARGARSRAAERGAGRP